ncbi:MAG TPA: squalene/phytoene synthase family protein [Candidatus Acidoferrum sp.]|nr:squalene/phytoene synthase family protein [Candidatus Acidoferrum sp.]
MREVPDGLREILKPVSRSFYLTLTVLPAGLRGPVGLAYLLARAADTIADTRIIPRAERLRHLDIFREALEAPVPSRPPDFAPALTGPQQVPAERELLTRLPECLALYRGLADADRRRIRNLLLTLTQGMQTELRTFPGEDEGRIVALASRADLDRHTYYAAGCVGEFWTEMAVAHRPACHSWNAESMKRRGVRFGQGLQLTNVLRDLARDLRIGRCFLPREDLALLGLMPGDLLDPAAIARLRPLLRELLGRTLEHLAEGWAYTLTIPRGEMRLRLACTWPLFIGLRTLQRIWEAPNLLDPKTRVKVSRPAVYAILARSSALAWSDHALGRYYRALQGRTAAALTLADRRTEAA